MEDGKKIMIINGTTSWLKAVKPIYCKHTIVVCIKIKVIVIFFIFFTSRYLNVKCGDSGEVNVKIIYLPAKKYYLVLGVN